MTRAKTLVWGVWLPHRKTRRTRPRNQTCESPSPAQQEAVGSEILRILEERKFPVSELALLASPKSAGKTIEAFGAEHQVQALDGFDFHGWDLALFSPGGAVSAIHAPRAAQAGCIVIDNTSHFRQEPDVPLVVPEVNGETLASRPPRGIIANPNCCAIQLVAALKPLADVAPLKRVITDTYQAASGAGASAMQELGEQTRQLYNGEEITPAKFQRQLAFNVIPQIDVFLDDGETLEEWKMRAETRKILNLPNLAFQATCVRVPVMVSHAIAAHLEFSSPLPPAIAEAALSNTQGIILLGENPNDFATPPRRRRLRPRLHLTPTPRHQRHPRPVTLDRRR